MFFRNSKLVLLMIVISILLLVSCGNSIENTEDNVSNKNEEAIKTEIVNDEGNTERYSNINYINYQNTRFGFSVDYPDFLIEQETPVNNDGRRFESEDGKISLSASGIYNVLDYTAEGEYNKDVDELSNITYKNLGDNYYEIAWIEGDEAFYTYSVVGGLITDLNIKYPVSEEEKFAEIIKRCRDSFTR